jgi:hypothetical protein
MQPMISIQESLFTPNRAEEIALMMNSDIHDDCVYTAIHDPKGTGKSFIRVHDAEGYYVGLI